MPLNYLEGYSPALQDQARNLLVQGRLEGYLRDRYAEAHEVRTDKALQRMAVDMKNRFMKNAPPLDKVIYDSKLQVLGHALGTLTNVPRIQGSRLKANREIRVASVFREAPAAFLRMILAHELAHLKETQHNKAFYQLCVFMEPDYHQLEFDLRLYLTMLEYRLECAQAANRPEVGRP
jgi:UTP pyrophosphatase